MSLRLSLHLIIVGVLGYTSSACGVKQFNSAVDSATVSSSSDKYNLVLNGGTTLPNQDYAMTYGGAGIMKDWGGTELIVEKASAVTCGTLSGRPCAQARMSVGWQQFDINPNTGVSASTPSVIASTDVKPHASVADSDQGPFTGTIDARLDTTKVVGTGTSFFTELYVGKTIDTGSVVGTGEQRKVVSIVSDTEMYVDRPFTQNFLGTQFRHDSNSRTSGVYFTGQTVDVTSGANTVTGTGTAFSTDFKAGMKITISSTGETRTIATIASDTSLTVDRNFDTTAVGSGLEDIRYEHSPIGAGDYAGAALNTGGGAAESSGAGRTQDPDDGTSSTNFYNKDMRIMASQIDGTEVCFNGGGVIACP